MRNISALGFEQEIFEIFCGETYFSKFGGEREFKVKLISIQTETEPFYNYGMWFDIFLSAKVNIEINGNKKTLYCKPYSMPVNINGLNIIVDFVKEVAGGTHPIKLSKDARFSAKVASLPWYSLGRFLFPMEAYRWRASNYIHTWNGLSSVKIDGQIYYHRGEDFGAIPDRHDMVAINDATVEKLPPPEGDGSSNRVFISDRTLRYIYSHANADMIRKDLYAGYQLKRGEIMAKTGNTFEGKPVHNPHLHIGMTLKEGDIPINTYPGIVQSYMEKYYDEILPVAGGFRFCLEEDTLEFDASCSIISESKKVRKYVWTFCDGEVIEGVKVNKKYKLAGTYTEELAIINEDGKIFRDYVMVSVSKEGTDLPSAYISFYPVRSIKIGTPVEFFITCVMKNAKIDFGDGVTADCLKHHKHSYENNGDYIATVYGESEKGVPGIFKVCVKVGG